MRTGRRQELRQNELSQQIEGITEYMKRNATAMTVIVVVAAVAVGGGFLYKNSQTNRRMEAWAAISMPGEDTTPAGRVSRAESIADERLSPGLTNAALLDVGRIAMQQLMSPPPAAAADAESGESDKQQTDWVEKARTAYTQIANQPNADVTALGQAYIALGILAENEGEMEKAADWYKKIVDSDKFAATPFQTQAQYRLDNLSEWKQPVVFAPAPEPAVPPVPLADPTFTPPAEGVQPSPPKAQLGEKSPPASTDGEYENKTIGNQLKHRGDAAEQAQPAAEEQKQDAQKPANSEEPQQGADKPAEPDAGGEG